MTRRAKCTKRVGVRTQPKAARVLEDNLLMRDDVS